MRKPTATRWRRVLPSRTAQEEIAQHLGPGPVAADPLVEFVEEHRVGLACVGQRGPDREHGQRMVAGALVGDGASLGEDHHAPLPETELGRENPLPVAASGVLGGEQTPDAVDTGRIGIVLPVDSQSVDEGAGCVESRREGVFVPPGLLQGLLPYLVRQRIEAEPDAQRVHERRLRRPAFGCGGDVQQRPTLPEPVQKPGDLARAGKRRRLQEYDGAAHRVRVRERRCAGGGRAPQALDPAGQRRHSIRRRTEEAATDVLVRLSPRAIQIPHAKRDDHEHDDPEEGPPRPPPGPRRSAHREPVSDDPSRPPPPPTPSPSSISPSTTVASVVQPASRASLASPS